VLQLVGIEDQASESWWERLEIPEGKSIYPVFVRWLRETITWDFGIAPLVENSFNRGKSALKFLEYAALGIPGIFSNVGEYGDVVEIGKPVC
jgi:hypothetical protein